MAEIAVLTGELLIPKVLADRDGPSQRLVGLLNEVRERYQAHAVEFRDHGFQLTLKTVDLAPECALFIRSGLVSASPSRRERWDVRLAIAAEKLDEADRRPERGSTGPGLAALGRGHMCFSALPASREIALDMATAFVDDIVSHWTPSEAEAYFERLRTPGGHKAIAQRLNKSRPTITKTLLRARYNLLDRYRRDVRALLRLEH